jgi:hypothetical protein
MIIQTIQEITKKSIPYKPKYILYRNIRRLLILEGPNNMSNKPQYQENTNRQMHFIIIIKAGDHPAVFYLRFILLLLLFYTSFVSKTITNAITIGIPTVTVDVRLEK